MSSYQITTSSIPVIGFLDVDSFECQLWQRDDPSTRSIPCIVANTSGRIVSVTHSAKALGINRKDTPTVKLAKQKCQNLHVFTKPDKYGKQDQSKCRLGTWQIVAAIQTFLAKRSITDVVLEVASSDEIYLDISAEISRGMELRGHKHGGQIWIPENIVWERETQTKPGPFYYRQPYQPNMNAIGMAQGNSFYTYKNQERLMFGALFMDTLCTHVESETGLKSSAGVAKNKLLAKVGCSLNKPGKITVLGGEAFRRVACLVKISSIPGLGGNKGQILTEKFGVEKVIDIFRIPFDQLKAQFGKITAQNIYSWAQGQCVDPVVAISPYILPNRYPHLPKIGVDPTQTYLGS